MSQVNKTKIDDALKEVSNKEETPSRVTVLTSNQLKIDQCPYELVTDYQNAFDAEKLNERYADILAKYDYIVGDWGFEQLRLKGFYENVQKNAQPDQKIATLQDYLYEYCNFGCAYFVIKRIGKPTINSVQRKRKPNNRRRKNEPKIKQANQQTGKPKPTNTQQAKKSPQKAFQPQKVKKTQVQPQNGQKAVTTNEKSVNKRHFKIRTLDGK